MSMSVEEKAKMGIELLNAIGSCDADHEKLDKLLDFTIISLIAMGESPVVICELLTLGAGEDIKKQISDGLVAGVKNSNNSEITGCKEIYTKTNKMVVEFAKRFNPSIINNVLPYNVVIGQAFIEAGQRICNGEAEI